jgi:hypothetical protein
VLGLGDVEVVVEDGVDEVDEVDEVNEVDVELVVVAAGVAVVGSVDVVSSVSGVWARRIDGHTVSVNPTAKGTVRKARRASDMAYGTTESAEKRNWTHFVPRKVQNASRTDNFA